MVEWRDIPNYECIYEACTDGKIRSKEGKITHSTRHGNRVWKSRVLKQKVDKENSCRVTLYKDKKEKTWLVHRLVALTFIPTIEGKNYINHIDGDRLNNSVENLEWCNHEENNNHAFDNDLIKTATKVKLIHKDTKEAYEFRSMSKASEFLGKNVGYISGLLIRNIFETDLYTINIK